MVKIAAMGDNVVDCYVSRDEMYPGGNCLNLAVQVSRFGGQSAYIGAIGNDAAGDLIYDALRVEHVDARHLRRLDGSTAYCLIGHQGAERIFLSFDLGVSMFAPSAKDFEFLRGFAAVHISQSSGLDAFLEDAAEVTRLSYDFSIRRDPGHRCKVGSRCYLASISAGDLSEAEANSLAEDLLMAGARWALVTRGRQGAVLSGKGSRFMAPVIEVEAVDTLGAGDTFIARTLFGLLKGERPDDVMTAAAAAAAATCQYYGAVGHAAKLNIPLKDLGSEPTQPGADLQV
jgi:fructoselysine 6-kinase